MLSFALMLWSCGLCNAHRTVLQITTDWLTSGPFAPAMLQVCALPLVSVLHIFSSSYGNLWSDNFPVTTISALLSSAVLLGRVHLTSDLQATVLLLTLLWYTLLLCWLLHLCWHLLYYWLLLHCLHQLWHVLLCYHLPCCCGHVAFSFSLS